MPISDWFLTSSERGNPHTRIDEGKPGEVAWSVGNEVEPLVHGRTYFARLHEHLESTVSGDRVYVVDWRGDADQRLTDDPEDTLVASLASAARRGVEVRGLLWRSHWHRFGYHAHKALELGARVEAAGGQCLRDMRVRTAGSHHQKFVVIRHRDEPTRDVAYVGGIDLCHSRRDDAEHLGDPQVLPMPAAYGTTPAWHDVHVALRGPAVHDVETTFRERWEDATPLTLNPGRGLSSWLRGESQTPMPLGAPWPAPPAVPNGHAAVQVVRTYPKILPVGYDFAPDGERSVVLANAKVIARARRLVYVEDQYFWSEQVGEHFASALRANPELRLVVVLPLMPDMDHLVGEKTQLYARKLALDTVLEAGGERVAVFGLRNEQGMPVYVHSKVCVIDERWASIGSDNLNRRSWTSDSEIACLVLDERTVDDDAPVPEDSFPRLLLRKLVCEHLGCSVEEVPEDPHELFDAMLDSARALQEWRAGTEGGRRHGLRSLPGRAAAHTRRKQGRRMQRARTRSTASASAAEHRSAARGPRPPGRLELLGPPELTAFELRWTPLTYAMFDPDGTVLRDENLSELAEPGPPASPPASPG